MFIIFHPTIKSINVYRIWFKSKNGKNSYYIAVGDSLLWEGIIKEKINKNHYTHNRDMYLVEGCLKASPKFSSGLLNSDLRTV